MTETNTAALVGLSLALASEHVNGCMRRRRMSAKMIADEIGVSESTVSRIARSAKRDMGTRALKKILAHRDKGAGEMK